MLNTTELDAVVFAAKLTRLSYRAVGEIRDALEGVVGSVCIVPFAFGLALASSATGETWLAFSGTKHLRDWYQNLHAKLAPCAWGRVHAGFSSDFHRCAADAVVETVRKFNQFAPDVHLCGHSRGGALALIAGASLEAMGICVRSITTFAAPKTGDAAFAESMQARILRVENFGDLVPYLPVGAFRPAGRLLYLARSGDLCGSRPILDRALETSLYAGGFLLALRRRDLDCTVVRRVAACHAMDSYCERLAATLENVG